MKPKFLHFEYFLKMLILSVFSLGMATPLNAEVLREDIGRQAIALAHKIESQHLILSETAFETQLSSNTLTAQERLRLFRKNFTRQVWSSDKETIALIAADYTQLAQDVGTETDIEVSALFETFTTYYSDEIADETFSNTRNGIEKFYESENWFVRHQAHNLVSLSYPFNSNLSLALETAQEGLKQIPAGEGAYALEAKLSSVSSLSYLHTMLLNVELSVKSYTEQIDLELASGTPVDGLGIINNLIYVFNAWRDTSTSKDLIDVLLSLEKKYPINVRGLTERRAAQIYAELGEYDTALTHARKAIEVCQMESLCKSAQFSEVTALAGLGRTEDARNALISMQKKYPNENWNSQSSTKKLYQIEALLAASEGDFVSALQYMNRKLDTNVQEILSKNNSQTANLLASLQNSKGRQDERAAALKRESELKQVALNRQTRITQLLVVLSVVLLVIVIAAVVFARYRSKIATRMEIAANKAVAGEKAKAEFLAIMSHELRTPLNGILGMADILNRKAETPDIKKKTGIIVDCGQDLLDLVENIFDMTLIESKGIHLYPERVNVHEMLKSSIDKWRPVIEANGVIFTAHIGKDVPQYMEADKTRLIKPIHELLSNAAKFTQKGRIHMHVSAVNPGETGEAELKVIVADTGVGISDEAQSRLFKPFVQADSSMTRHFGGAGLGLAIARGLAQMMGGDIKVNSRNGRGSEFTLTLTAPALSAPSQSLTQNRISSGRADENKTPECSAQNISMPSARILVAEDDIACQDLLRSLLEPTGARVICTINGKEALEALSLNHYDLVITDIRMPGMDGVTTIRRIRQSRQDHHDVPIIALTADVAAETNARCKAAGVDVFLTKPVKADDLYTAIANVKEKSRTPAPAAKSIAS